MKHDNLVQEIVRECNKLGIETKLETPIPNGKRAVDISDFYNNVPLFHSEVKSSPTSINKKKVQSQLNLYKNTFGNGPDYTLISPGATGIYAQSLDNGSKI